MSEPSRDSRQLALHAETMAAVLAATVGEATANRMVETFTRAVVDAVSHSRAPAARRLHLVHGDARSQ